MTRGQCFELTQDNSTALSLASKDGRDEVVGVLIAAKATVDAQDKVSLAA